MYNILHFDIEISKKKKIAEFLRLFMFLDAGF